MPVITALLELALLKAVINALDLSTVFYIGMMVGLFCAVGRALSRR